MKNSKYLLGTAALVLFHANAYAQINLKGPAQQLSNEIRGIFPYVALAIFIVVVLTQLGRFVNENGDWKKAVTVIVIFAAVLGVVQGLITYVANMKV